MSYSASPQFNNCSQLASKQAVTRCKKCHCVTHLHTPQCPFDGNLNRNLCEPPLVPATLEEDQSNSCQANSSDPQIEYWWKPMNPVGDLSKPRVRRESLKRVHTVNPKHSCRALPANNISPPILSHDSSLIKSKSQVPTFSSMDRSEECRILRQQVFALAQSLVGVSTLWYNEVSPATFTSNNSPSRSSDAIGRLILDYLHPCRPTDAAVEETFRAIYYTVGTSRQRACNVPPPPDDAPYFREIHLPVVHNAGGALPIAFDGRTSTVVRHGEWWKASVDAVQSLTENVEADCGSEVNCEILRNKLAQILGISNRRVDVFPSGKTDQPNGTSSTQLTLAVYDSEEPSAKSAMLALREMSDIVTSSENAVSETLQNFVDMQTWNFLGLAREVHNLSVENRLLRNSKQKD